MSRLRDTLPRLLALVCILCIHCEAAALGQKRYVETVSRPGSFAIARGRTLATIYIDRNDYAGVVRAARDLQADVTRVTGRVPSLVSTESNVGADVILIGTIGKSAIIDELIQQHKIDVSSIAGQWESFLIQVVARPLPGVAKGLVIAGSDKRGTIYGIYDLSEQMGVSPWYWWADVPVRYAKSLFVRAGKYTENPPAVKYRGIFLNDEAPALTGWAMEKFGNLNHEFYEKVFELLLRLKANYLWPAMWSNAFDVDDPSNAKLADEYGIVMGTSHHEPMMRAWKEWEREGTGPWDYSTNAEELRSFWKAGIERNNHYESIVTLGMRGNGDEPMVKGGDAAANISLLEQIVTDQRKIIGDTLRADAANVPEDWALYKEVQEYYEQGMRVPDDVTLLWCDDNWGNLRRLPTLDERARPGGAGIYYHFDYVGEPRSYKWLNTTPITKVWEQMNLAHAYGANRVWVVNVGDLKPMEFPIEFFLDFARDPTIWPKEKIAMFTQLWAEREFGPKYAPEIAGIICRYTKFNGRRKPELLESDTFSLVNYREAERVESEWMSVTHEAERIYRKLPVNQRDAFFELVLYPAKASAQVAELYITVGKNRLYASQGRASTNDLAAHARKLFQADADLSSYYNHNVAHGKWDHMMDQTHIGYTSWRDPPANVMPQIKEIEVPVPSSLGIAVEGSPDAWPGAAGTPVLPQFDAFNRQRRYIDIFNRGRTSCAFTAKASEPWIVLSATLGHIEKGRRIWVRIDWDRVSHGTSQGSVAISGAGKEVTVKVEAFNPISPRRSNIQGFAEANGYISMEAEHFTRKIDAGSVGWQRIPGYGRTHSSMTIFPVTTESVRPPQSSACLEYKMYLFHAGTFELQAIMAPTLNFVPKRGLRFAISFDDQTAQIVDALAHNGLDDWAISVKDSVRIVKANFTLEKPGYHTLKIWMVDPGIVLQKIVIDTGGLKSSYLGPPESYQGAMDVRPSSRLASQKSLDRPSD